MILPELTSATRLTGRISATDQERLTAPDLSPNMRQYQSHFGLVKLEKDVTDTSHAMTYAEREALKTFARNNENLEETIIMIAHWMRQDLDIGFSNYAANWAIGHRETNVKAMLRQWPLKGERHIKDGGSDWHINPIISDKV